MISKIDVIFPTMKFKTFLVYLPVGWDIERHHRSLLFMSHLPRTQGLLLFWLHCILPLYVCKVSWWCHLSHSLAHMDLVLYSEEHRSKAVLCCSETRIFVSFQFYWRCYNTQLKAWKTGKQVLPSTLHLPTSPCILLWELTLNICHDLRRNISWWL